jgi:hypothetical protein
MSILFFNGLFKFINLSEGIFYAELFFYGIDLIPYLKFLTYLVIYISYTKLVNRLKKAERDSWNQREKLVSLESESIHKKYEKKLSKVDPDFFYSTIERSEKLIEQDEHEAENLVLKLSKYYRSQLNVSSKQFCNIEDEIELARNYCYLKNIEIKVAQQVNLLGVQIASGLLLMLVKELSRSNIEIEISLENDFIKIKLDDTNFNLKHIREFVSLFYSEFKVFQEIDSIVIMVLE